MRSITVDVLARGDTATPVKALRCRPSRSMSRSRCVLMGSYAQVGLAFATSIGAWINFAPVAVVRGARAACSASTTG